MPKILKEGTLMFTNEDLLAFSYDDEYDENFMESDADFEAGNDFEKNKDDSIDSLDDEIYNEIFDGMSDIDAIEAEALAAVSNGGAENVPQFDSGEEVFDDFSNENDIF